MIDSIPRTESTVPQALRTRVRRTLLALHGGEATDAEIEQLEALLQRGPELAAFARRIVELQAAITGESSLQVRSPVDPLDHFLGRLKAKA